MTIRLQKIFKAHFPRYVTKKRLPLKQLKAANAIIACRTDAMGGHVQYCPEGHETKVQYHSCRHRSCPRCAALPKAKWAQEQSARLLRCDHYHVVFTLPHEFLVLWQYNTAWFMEAMFQSCRDTLFELLHDEKYLGVTPGVVMALHTWGRNLSLHPHIHCLVTGGGLTTEGHWRTPDANYLLPVRVVKALYRGKMLSRIRSGLKSGEITLPRTLKRTELDAQLSGLYKKSWSVRIQERYAHGDGVMRYLARYIKGGPLNERSIVQANANTVSFSYKDHRDGKRKLQRLKISVFLDRVMWHVPEPGLHTIRHYGLYAHQSKQKRQQCREQLGQGVEEKANKLDWQDWLKALGKVDSGCCRVCGASLVMGPRIEKKRWPITNSIERWPRTGFVQLVVQANTGLLWIRKEHVLN